MFKKCFKVHNFPIITAIWFTATYILTYITAVLEGHVSPLFPYISWSGVLPPESCIFSFLLNMGSVLMFIVIFIRYKLLELIAELHMPKYLNVCTLGLGVISCLGINLVANFQESYLFMVHVLGALCAFGGATLYCCIQAWLTWRYDGSSKFLIIFRIILCVLMVPALFDVFLFGDLAGVQFNGTQYSNFAMEK
ncbi:DNA damage-regulated autophagy modulator protein 2-like isoform X2 [Anoplophora glabripennis]|uniref:DNA damage-regulated autophagy modulator protein 2-like isoform X2 n=1 Tax=Anoplophora glabripennis TaxID=217634 RepID=UPI000874E601|nr:DNA damage-regulated autophagy modulator protein 2-like isoform X2 [Anoplophora glabripennis]